MSLLFLIPLAVSGSAIGVALWTSSRGWWNRFTVIGGLAWAVVVVAIVAGEHDPEVTTASFVRGLLLAGGLMALTPWLLYHALGRLLARHPIVLALIWAVSIVPLYYLEFIALLLSVDAVACTPDAYECPV